MIVIIAKIIFIVVFLILYISEHSKMTEIDDTTGKLFFTRFTSFDIKNLHNTILRLYSNTSHEETCTVLQHQSKI